MSNSHNHAHRHLQFELVSPEKLMMSRPVAMVTVPGGEGDYGVLVQHAPMITTVKPGVIEVFAEENAPPSERIFVSGGFAEVTPQHCVVLADEAISVLNIDRLELEEQMKDLQARLTEGAEADREALCRQQVILEAKIKAVAAL